MRVLLTASYEYEVTPGEGGFDFCTTAAECIAVDLPFADELIVDAIANGEEGTVKFTIVPVKEKKAR